MGLRMRSSSSPFVCLVNLDCQFSGTETVFYYMVVRGLAKLDMNNDSNGLKGAKEAC